MAERAHPENPAFQGTAYGQDLRDRYAACAPFVAGKDVLDAPCGTGWGSSMLENCRSITGLDIDFASVQYGEQHFDNARFVAGSMSALPFAASSFDVVICLEGLEHVLRSEAAQFLSETARVLRPGGAFIATVPLRKNGKHSRNPYHLYEYLEEEAIELLQAHFESQQYAVREAPEGPNLFFIGTRRDERQAVVNTASAESVVRRAAAWLDSVRVDGGFAFAPGGPKTVIATCLGVLLLESAGELRSIPQDERRAWVDFLASCQDASTGLFADPLGFDPAPACMHDAEYLRSQTTYFALQALDALDDVDSENARAPYPLAFLDQFAHPGDVESWLAARDWGNAWLESNRVMYLLASVIYRVEREGHTQDHAILHRALDWLDRTQDSETGLWGTERGSTPLNALAGAYHFFPFYDYVRRPITNSIRIIDAALALQQPDGLFAGEPGGGACEDLDAIDVLTTLSKYTVYRAAEVRRSLVRAFWSIWNLQNQDGSFPYAARGAETYSFSSWPPMTARVNGGDVWSTWFRTLALATIATALPGDLPSIPWIFRRWPALGYHRFANDLTAHDRSVLRLWMRSAVLSAPVGSEPRVTVVVTCYNLGAYLHEAIASAIAQTLQPLRIVVVDDGSTDEYTSLLLDAFPYTGIDLIRQPNRGVAFARNVAIAAAGTDYICCLDADDRLRPEYLAEALQLLDSRPETGFVSCHYQLFDCDHDVYRYNDCRLPQMLVRNEAVIASVFRKTAWEAAGGYAEHLTGMHDWDLWIGMLENGFCGYVIPRILFDYRVRPGSMYSVTTQPSNYERLMREIARRHQRTYQEHAVDVIALKARQFIELVQLRSKERELSVRVITSLQRDISQRESTIAALDHGRRWLEGQVENWKQVAEDSRKQHEDAKRWLETQVDNWKQAAEDSSRQHEEAKRWLETQAQSWMRAATESADYVRQLEQRAADLETQIANLQSERNAPAS